jgi:hypothetical protein
MNIEQHCQKLVQEAKDIVQKAVKPKRELKPSLGFQSLQEEALAFLRTPGVE